MKVGSCGVLDLSRVYPKTPFEPMFYSWWNCPLSHHSHIKVPLQILVRIYYTFDMDLYNTSPTFDYNLKIKIKNSIKYLRRGVGSSD